MHPPAISPTLAVTKFFAVVKLAELTLRGFWLSRDPVQEWGGINLYEFVANSPSVFIDQFGLCPTNQLPPQVPPLKDPPPKKNRLEPPYKVGPVEINPFSLSATSSLGDGWTGAVSYNPFNGAIDVSAQGQNPWIRGTTKIDFGNNEGRGGGDVSISQRFTF
jgi:hypothetical protein